MAKFKPASFLKKIKPSGFLIERTVRLFAILLILLIIPTISNLQLGVTQPLNYESAVIEIEKVQDSQSASPSVKPKQAAADHKIINTKVNPKVEVGSKNLSPLCVGVTEPWKLVPNPEHEGQFIICNAKNDKMATVDELNVAQNDYRVKHGLNNLSINADLCKVAAERAREIATDFSHSGFEPAIERNNIQKSSVGENIASGPLTATQFVEWSWDKSPGHKENMLRDWSEGCGGVYDRFAVFIFAK